MKKSPRQLPTIFFDPDEGPRVVRREKGERVNFLYAALIQARAHTDADVLRTAKDALFVEIMDYCGVVLRKEANRHGWNLPGSDPSEGDMAGPMDYRPDGEAPARLDQLLDSEFRQEAATKIFFKLDTFKGKSAFHTWAYKIIANVIMDAITKRRKYRTVRPASFSNIPSAEDAAGTASGADGAAMTRNHQEDRVIGGLDAVMHPNPRWRSEAEARAELSDKFKALNKLYRKQSFKDRLLITMRKDGYPDRLIAAELNWTIKKIYNRTAKLKKIGLLQPKQVNLQKRAYNRRARAKLVKSN